MSRKKEHLEWPEEIEEIHATELHPIEAVNIDTLRKRERDSSSVDDDLLEDGIYLSRIRVLTDIANNGSAILALSDGVTNHMVVFRQIFTQSRQYMIVFKESWPPERGTFLQEGKNVAGVKAQAYDAPNSLWMVTHNEFFKVYDGALHVEKKDQ